MPNYNSEIAKVLAQGRAELKNITNETAQGILSAYAASVKDIQARYADLSDKAAQGNIGADTARKMLLPIKKQAEQDMANWAAVASGKMDDGNAKSFLAGCGFASSVGDVKNITFRMGTSDRLAFQAAYTATQSGPLHELLSGIAKDTIDDTALAVRNSILASEGSKRMSKRLQAATTASAARCDLIARTEVARAYREATLLSYEQMGVNYIKWESAEQTRTCSACWAMDGHIYEMGKIPNDHPRGRCKLLALSDTEIEELKAEHGDNWQDGVYQERVAQNTETLKKKPQSELEMIFGSKKQAEIFNLGAPLQAAARIISNDKWGASVQRRVFQNLSHAQQVAEAHAARLAAEQAAALAAAEAAAAQAAQDALDAAQAVKQAHKDELSKLTAAELKELSKGGVVPFWQWATKQELIDVLSDADPVAVAKAHENIAIKHEQWVVAQKLNKVKAKELAKQAELDAAQAAKEAELALQAEQAAKAAHEAAVAAEKAAAHAAAMAAIQQAKIEAEAAAAKAEAEAKAKLQAEAEAKAKAQAIKAEKAAATKAKKAAAAAQAKLDAEAQQAKLEAELAEVYAKFKAEQEATLQAQAAEAAKQAEVEAAAAAKTKLEGATKKKKAAQSTTKGKKAAAEAAGAIKQEDTPTPATAPGKDFDAIDAFWEANHGNDRWKKQGAANLGGMHAKDIYVDKDGARWLFKPERREPWRCHADETSYKIGRIINPDTIEVRAVTLDGTTGTIQKLETELATKSDFKGVPIQTLTMSEKNQILAEQVTDWLIGNHDSHSENFLRLKDGRILGIDKGQAYKFMGKDSLTINYSPNPVPPMYNTLLQAAKAGAIDIDPSALLPAIRAVEAITDAEYRATLQNYAHGRFAGKPNDEEAFYKMAIARKNSIRADFEKLYADATNTPGFKFEAEQAKATKKATAAKAKKATPAVDDKALLTHVETAVEDARRVGWQGKAIRLDTTDVEEQNALVYVEYVKDQPRTIIKMKMRPDADARIVANIQQANPDIQVVQAAPVPHATIQTDAYYGDILAAVKTVNVHAVDGKYNENTITTAMSHSSTLFFIQLNGNPDEVEMATKYLEWLAKLDKAKKDKEAILGKFEPYVAKPAAVVEPPAPAPKAASDKMQATAGAVTISKRKVQGGKIIVVDDNVSNTAVYGTNRIKTGLQYTVDLGDGAVAKYKPWSDENMYAQGGELEIVVKGDDPQAVARALEQAKILGINTSLATQPDRELLYLIRTGAVNLEHKKAPYRNLLAKLDADQATTEDRVEALAKYWSKKLKVDDVRALPTYKPDGEHDRAYDGSEATAGMVQQYRFDMTPERVKEEMDGYSVYHGLTNGGGYAQFFRDVLPNSGALVATTEKARVGVPVQGLSPAADLNTGGANYVFTRIWPQPKRLGRDPAGLYFKTDVLRRLDAVSYDHDAYGDMRGNYTDKRKSDPEGWKKACHTNRMNETDFKYSLTLVDNLEWVVVSSETERKGVIQAFMENGITVLPDGRKVADIVIMGG